MLEILEEVLYTVVSYGVVFFELVGLVVLILSGLKGLLHYLTKKSVCLDLAKGLSVGLEFLLVGEIMHTIIARTMQEILIVGGIVVLRVTLTLLIHWEIKTEEAHEEAHKD